MKRMQWGIGTLTLAGVIAACAGSDTLSPAAGGSAAANRGNEGRTRWDFQPLLASAVCTNGGDPVKPFNLPEGFDQEAIASEPSYADTPDMNTQNENGHDAGRYVYRTHEVGSNGSISVTDLRTGVTKIIAQRADWEALDGSAWTPWGTLLFAEETNAAAFRDPDFPQAVAGLVYEVFFDRKDPTRVVSVKARPAIGSKSHEGMRFDARGNLYSISERTPGYIFKFVPDRKGDLSSGQTYVLKIVAAAGDRVGQAQWVALDRAAVQIDASAAADAVGATGYGRPEDLEMETSTGNSPAGDSRTLFAAITSENRVIAIDLRENHGDLFTVRNYVARGLNVDDQFLMPDNLALNKDGDLYITEDPGGNTASGKRGDDIWVARAGERKQATPEVARFATLTDCEAEPTGVYFDMDGDRLFVNVQHRGGDRLDKTMAIKPKRGH